MRTRLGIAERGVNFRVMRGVENVSRTPHAPLPRCRNHLKSAVIVRGMVTRVEALPRYPPLITIDATPDSTDVLRPIQPQFITWALSVKTDRVSRRKEQPIRPELRAVLARIRFLQHTTQAATSAAVLCARPAPLPTLRHRGLAPRRRRLAPVAFE